MNQLVFGDHKIATDGDNVCLNDMWALASKPDNKRARDWYRGKRAQSLEVALQDRIVEIFHKPRKDVAGTTYYTLGRGGGARTFAHPVLALDYAEYLSPDLAVEIRETFLRYKAGDVGLALEIMDGLAEQADYDEQRVAMRRLLAEHNTMSAGAAKAAGVKDFAAYNGSGLRGLYGGMSKAQVTRHKGLAATDNHLDHAGHEELAANYFKATQVVAKLKRDTVIGQDAANAVHEEVAIGVRKTIADLGGVMPEDEPALDNISEAKKRLKAADIKPKALPSMPPKK